MQAFAAPKMNKSLTEPINFSFTFLRHIPRHGSDRHWPVRSCRETAYLDRPAARRAGVEYRQCQYTRVSGPRCAVVRQPVVRSWGGRAGQDAARPYGRNGSRRPGVAADGSSESALARWQHGGARPAIDESGGYRNHPGAGDHDLEEIQRDVQHGSRTVGLTMAGDLNQALNISATGMDAQTQRLRVIAQNIANQDTTGSSPGPTHIGARRSRSKVPWTGQ